MSRSTRASAPPTTSRSTPKTRPEEYLRLVEAQGLKIQLRSPMKPVVKLAFDGMCDDATIKQLEAVLAWAFDQELPRGALPSEIEAAGGIAADPGRRDARPPERGLVSRKLKLRGAFL